MIVEGPGNPVFEDEFLGAGLEYFNFALLRRTLVQQ